MRKLFIGCLLVSGFASQAQTEKGSVLLGGALSFQTTKNNSSFVLNPNVGFFPFNNLACGLVTNFNFSKQGDNKNNQFGFGPYARYYVGKTQTKPFVTTEFSYLHSTIKSGITESSTNGFGFLLGLGFAAFINETVAIEGLTGYNYSDFTDSESANGFAMRFGFQLYFNKKNYNQLKTNVIGE